VSREEGRPVSPAEIVDRITREGVVPVLVLESADVAVPVCEALLAGGITVAEVTFRTADAADAIARIRDALPDMLVGAGTLLTGADVLRAKTAGASFGVSPGLSESTVRAAQEAGLLMIPGVCTPSDIERGLALRLEVLKFFPAGVFGGEDTLKALLGAYRHTGVRFMPTGGVTIDNAPTYWAIPEVVAVGATALAPTAVQREGRWQEITTRAIEFRVAFHASRPNVSDIQPTMKEDLR
jgi:2-dehydro-3-deoxyphosphogluconate aldolase/(4S)-4-hydroxy-2-oxoglutarate aldolase